MTVGTCILPDEDPDSFCGGLALHAWQFGAMGAPDELVFVQGVGTFRRVSGLADSAYAARLIRTAWPAELP